jgi:hypothetical protein
MHSRKYLRKSNVNELLSRQTFAWNEENGIPKFAWHTQSLDLNIIENVWHCIKIKLSHEVDKIEK